MLELLLAALLGQQPAAPPAGPALDYEFYKARVEPLFLEKREGHARALGELVTCPHCIGLWAASGFAYSLVLFPRQTRLVTTIFGGQAVADFLNAAFVRLRDD